MNESLVIVNRHRLKSIDSYEARKLPDGTVLLYGRALLMVKAPGEAETDEKENP